MKLFKTLFLIFAICLFVLSASSFAATVSAKQSRQTQSDNNGEQKSYIVRRSGEDVAVFDATGSQQLGTLDVRYSELPPQDRELLECGIMVSGEEQLISLIEDYTG